MEHHKWQFSRLLVMCIGLNMNVLDQPRNLFLNVSKAHGNSYGALSYSIIIALLVAAARIPGNYVGSPRQGAHARFYGGSDGSGTWVCYSSFSLKIIVKRYWKIWQHNWIRRKLQTSCVMDELTKENVELSQYLVMSKDVSVARCSHGGKGVISSGECIQDAIGAENSKCFFVATASDDLSSMLKQVPSVPIMRLHGGVLSLQKPSKLQKTHAQQAKGRAPKRKSAAKSAASVSSEVPHKKRQLVNPAEKWHCIANRFLSDEENSDDDPARKMVNEMTEGQNNTVVVAGFTVYPGFDFEMVKCELRERFKSCGEILRIFVVPDKITGLPKEVAFITFADRESVYKALRQSGSVIGASAITVEVEQGRSRGIGGRSYVD